MIEAKQQGESVMAGIVDEWMGHIIG
jgi:hypothetical protein